MWKKQSNFWELSYWKDLYICHSIDVMHVKKNMCESLLGTLLNTDGKTRDHGHARADLKKMGVRTKTLMACVELDRTLSRKVNPDAFLFEATKGS
jgi:hypothetical protein